MKSVKFLFAAIILTVIAVSCVKEAEQQKETMSAVTGAATHISCRNAELSGKANLPGTTSTDLSFGVLYSTSSGVLIGSATQIEARAFDSDYNYTVNTEVLEPETTYYYRSYIIQDKDISYGELKSFTTLALSSMIQTLDVTEINPKDAVLNASLDLTDCIYDALEYGFEVTPEGGSTRVVKSTNHSDKIFSAKDESLSGNTKYSAVAYVKLDGRTYKGDAKGFSSTSVLASVTAESSNVGCKTATISGNLTVESTGTFTKSVVLYYSSTANTLDALKSSGVKRTLTLEPDGSYSINLTSLIPNTRHNYIVVSKVDEIELITEVKSFKTLQILASITAESSEVGSKTATISGKLTVESTGTFTKSVVLYYSSTASTLDALKSSGVKRNLTLEPDGSYSGNLLSLTPTARYNYVVVSKVDELEIKTEVKSFTTTEIRASVIAESSNVGCNTATISGKLTVEYRGSFTKSANLYYSSTASTLDALKSNGILDILTLGSDGGFSILVEGLERSTKYYCVVVSKVDDVEFGSSVISFTTLIPSCPSGAVDLGLSVCWATCNVGASKPEDYGGHYQWAGLEDVSTTSIYLDYSNCPYHTGSNYLTGWTKYNYASSHGTVDNKTILDPDDDVAHAKLGGSWRMPTSYEWIELENTKNCSWTWTSINGIYGWKVQSKRKGFTDNWIFLPEAGMRYASGLIDYGGAYWSSSLYIDPYDARALGFGSRSLGPNMYDTSRCNGLSVRPVSE